MPAVERQPAAGPWPSPTEAAAAAAAAGGTGSGGLGFGVVGCGMISGFHAKALDAMDGAQLVACYDAIPAAAEQFGAANGCTVYSDLTAMLSDPAVDVVTICTPSGAHLEPAVAAAQHGKHVVVEKPLEVTLERCDAIIDACDAAGVTLGTILPTRFHESSQKLKEAIEQGRFGTLSLGGAYVKWWRDQEYYDSGAWRGTWAMDGGGALMNQAIHTVVWTLLDLFRPPD
jgi:UDP-N-acetyl-2-amino-2-deoxyglucuronate dehydrogenase